MFIKRDTRKVEDILKDPDDERVTMKLQRRAGEFERGTGILFSAESAPCLAKTRALSLYGNELKEVAGLQHVCSTTPLVELNLGLNELTTLPPELGQLEQLERLWLDDNKLQVFPQPILALSALTELRLNGNQLSRLEGISALTELRLLDLEGNQLTELPSEIGTLSQLESLLLRGNRLQSLPDELGDLKRLTRLHVNSNQLQALPPALGRLPCLRVLLANANQLVAVPEELAQLATLQDVSLAYNDISHLPSILTYAWLPSLPKRMRVLPNPTQDSAAAGAGGDDDDDDMDRGDAAGEELSLDASLESLGAARFAGEVERPRLQQLDLRGNPVYDDPTTLFSASQLTQPLIREVQERKRREDRARRAR